MVPSLQEVPAVIGGEVAKAAEAAAELVGRGLMGSKSAEEWDKDENDDEILKLLYCHTGSTGRVKIPDMIKQAVLKPLESIAGGLR